MIINLTPHTINFYKSEDDFIEIESSGIARVSQKDVPAGSYMGFELVKQEFGDVEGLPEEPECGCGIPACYSGKFCGQPPAVMYIVSGMVRASLPEREDLLSPSDMVRDKNGRILGCRSFAVNWK